MDDHSKREGLEIFNLYQKSVFVWCFLLKPSATCQMFAFFTKTITWHVTWSTALLIMLRNVKDNKIFLSAKFQFSVIQFVKVMLNKPFFPLKALNPGLKLLEFKGTFNFKEVGVPVDVMNWFDSYCFPRLAIPQIVVIHRCNIALLYSKQTAQSNPSHETPVAQW